MIAIAEIRSGTAIALQLGHRESIDFDFFSDKTFSHEEIIEKLPFLKNQTVTQSAERTLSINVGDTYGNEVKISFFWGLKTGRYADPLLTDDKVLQVANLEDLMALKLKVIFQRVEIKDYKDVAVMLRHGVSLSKSLNIASAFWPDTFSIAECLKALVYFSPKELIDLNKEDKLQLYNSVNQYQYSDEIINITEKSLSISDVIVMSRVPSKQTMKP